MKFNRKEIIYWSIFSLYTLFIIATLPYIVPFQRALGYKLADNLLTFIIISIALVFVLLISYIFFVKREKSLRKYLGILVGIILVAFTVWWLILSTTYSRASKAVEFIHFFQYGLLCFLAYLCLKDRIKNPLIFIWGAMIVSTFGFIDEGIQWIIPSRTGELKDSLTNIACAVTFQIFISQIVEPKSGYARINKHDWKGLLKGLTLLFVVVTLFVFFVNTGFKIFDEEIGYFNSKFTKEDLLEMKKYRDELFKRKSDKKIKESSEPIVIKPSYWGVTDYYAQEARFHIKHRNDLLKDKEFRASYSEQKILEKYYMPVVHELNENWSAHQRRSVFFKIPDLNNSYYYHSPLRDNIMVDSTKVFVIILLMLFSIIPLVVDFMTD